MNANPTFSYGSLDSSGTSIWIMKDYGGAGNLQVADTTYTAGVRAVLYIDK